ncbi:MAG: hypothetical protein KBC34_14550 [Phenylobacterium sp.]|nr:hypothetical protein [Phenylobacterium sp.]
MSHSAARHRSAAQFAKDMIATGELDANLTQFFQDMQRNSEAWAKQDQAWVDAEARPVPPSDPKASAVSQPLQDWLARQEARAARDQEMSRKLDAAGQGGKAARAFSQAHAQGSQNMASGAGEWTTIIVDSTGEVIVNDARDVGEARLEDLSSSLEDLLGRLDEASDPETQAQIRRELVSLDRQLLEHLRDLAEMISSSKSEGRSICRPLVPNRPYPALGCDYWATNTPITVPQGEGDSIIIDHAELSVGESDGMGPRRWELTLWSRYESEPRLSRQSEPSRGVSGRLRRTGANSFELVAPFTDEAGVQQSKAYPLDLTTEAAGLRGWDEIDAKSPLDFRFVRDAENYIPWEEAKAAMEGRAPPAGKSQPQR